MNRVLVWTLATRPKTWIASVSPVLIGTVLAAQEGRWSALLLVFTLSTALGIQIVTNLANDYFDFVKGADTAARKGFLRVTQSGLVTLGQMRRALVVASVLTALCAGVLVWHGGPWIGVLFAVSLLLAFLYTAGPYPLAYLGLGEVFVLLFFGLAAVAGTYFLQVGRVSIEALVAGICPGALSTAILVVNNVRDEEEDRRAKKKTLVVWFGSVFGRLEYGACLLLGFVPLLWLCQFKPLVLLPCVLVVPAGLTFLALWKERDGFKLNPLFAKTGQLLLFFTLLFCIGWLC